MILCLQFYKSLLYGLLHKTEFAGDLLIVTSCEYFVQLLHCLVICVNMLSLRLYFVVKFECGRNYVLSLDYKVVEVLLLICKCGACRTFGFIETFLYHLQTLQIDKLTELLITKRGIVFK